MKSGTVFVQKSTVPVGTGAKIEKQNKKFNYVSNPEFLREGTAIIDSLWPDRVVVGGQDTQSSDRVMALYKTIEKHREEIVSRTNLVGLDVVTNYTSTNLSSAELIKVTANAFLALKISFANSIAKLADNTGADVKEVMDAVGADHRIGRAFLNAGRGYGGGCFPKDVTGLISSASEYGVDLTIMTAVSELNETMPGYIANKVQSKLGGLRGKKLAVLGLAFKPGTSDARKSPGVKLANILAHSGARVSVYDPQANGEAKEDLRRDVIVCDSMETAIKQADAVCITTDWPEFINYDLGKLAKLMSGDLFVDAMNSFTPEDIAVHDLIYVGVGRY